MIANKGCIPELIRMQIAKGGKQKWNFVAVENFPLRRLVWANNGISLRILVTGSSGFIGSALTSALAKVGHHVRAASRERTAIADAPGVEWVELPDLEHKVDWAPLVGGMDIVIHLAAIAHRSHVDSGQYTRANRVATASLAQACAEHGIKRIIFMSSIGAQAGSAADYVVTETDEPWPITAYDRAKLAAEEEIRRSGVPFSILRPVIVYGPGAKANIAMLMRIAALPLPLPFGAFTNRRSLLSIDNLVQAVDALPRQSGNDRPDFHRLRSGADHPGGYACDPAAGGGPVAESRSGAAGAGQGAGHCCGSPVALGPHRTRFGRQFGRSSEGRVVAPG